MAAFPVKENYTDARVHYADKALSAARTNNGPNDTMDVIKMTIPELLPTILVCAYGLLLLFNLLFVKSDSRMKLNGLCAFAVFLTLGQGLSVKNVERTMLVTACVFPIVCYSSFSYYKHLARTEQLDVAGKAKV